MKIFGSCSAFAPDETKYVELYRSVYENGVSPDIYLALTDSLFLRLYYFLCYLFDEFFRMGDLNSLRASTIIYFCIAMAIIFKLITEKVYDQQSSRFKPLLICSLISFIPSLFVWTSFGLRESMAILCLSFILLAIFLIEQGKKFRGSTLLVFALWLADNIRPYFFVILLLSLLLLGAFRILQKSIRINLINILLVAIFSFLVLFASNTKDFFYFPSVNNASQNEYKSTLSIGNNNTIIGKTAYELGNCESNLITDFSSKIFLGSNKFIDTNPKTSIIPRTTIREGDDTFGTIANPLSFPRSMLLFWLSPVPVFQFSLLSLAYSVEFFSIASIALILLIYLFKRSFSAIKHNSVMQFSLIFSFIFSSVSSLVSVNLGTMLRHRILLLPLLAIFLSSIIRRKKNTSA